MIKDHLKSTSYRKGFTLVEMLIVIVILGLVIGMAMRFWWFFSQSYQFSVGEALSSDRAFGAVSRIAKELREVTAAETGAYPLETVNDQELVFYANVDSDDESERVRYFLSGNEFRRGVVQPAGDPVSYDLGTEVETVVVDGVENGADPIFSYYDENWPADAVTNPLDFASRLLATRMIGVRLIVRDSNDLTEDPVEVTHKVMLRTLKGNL